MSDAGVYIKEAARAHSQLVVWAAVQALLEANLVSMTRPASSKVIKICLAEQHHDF